MSANGRLTAGELVTVQGSIQLSVKAGAAYLAMEAAATAEGTTIVIPIPAGGYRSYAMQVDMRLHPERYNLNSSSTVPIAAPGYSTHGWGTAVDIVGDQKWAVRNASRFGFSRPFGTRDPNHFQHDGSSTAGGDIIPIEEADMAGAIQALQVRDSTTGAIVACIPGVMWQPLNKGYYDLWVARGWFEENDYTVSPNINVATNEVTYLQSLWAPQPAILPTIDINALAAAIVAALPAGSTAPTVEEIVAGVKTIIPTEFVAK
jgi:hypothetical protein